MEETKPKESSPLNCCRNSSSSLSDIETANNNNSSKFSILPQPIKQKHSFPKKQAIDLEFNNVTYTACSWSVTRFQKEKKHILHGVSGVFKAGELSVIMGPSGAGKSTLLNILAGFITRDSTGEVKLNGVLRTQSPRFRKLSAYIPQDEELRVGLTAKESMTFAAHLKLGYAVSREYKEQQVVQVMELLGLERCHHTQTSRLSGGQRKRLAIALELLSNPPILFLDEPTTGLDSSSTTQCVSLLKRLAKEGRTIVCTIHQPSALLFEMFDTLYSLSLGKCIYDGPARDLVPHLSSIGLDCPAYHNPADFLMEVAIGEYGTDIDMMAEAAKKAKLKQPQSKKEREAYNSENNFKKTLLLESHPGDNSPIPAAVIMQFLLLYRRSLLQNKRCWLYMVNKLLAHVVIGFIFGYLYKGVGNSGNKILANYVYLYGSLLLNVYTGKMSVTLAFPLDMKFLAREHFNRWYKLTPYLLSVLLVDIPFQIFCTWSYVAITYFVTSQPSDFRLFLFVLFLTLSTLCAQSWGYFIGATTPTKVAVFVGPVIACFLSVFGFCIRRFDTPYYFKWLFELSYYRAGFQGIVYSMYSFGRKELDCPENVIYCHYSDPSKFLKEMDIVDVDLVSNIVVIVGIWCVMSAATYLTLWLKLNKR